MIIKCNDDLFTNNDDMTTGLFINTENVTSYVIKKVPCTNDCVLRAMFTNGGALLIAKGARQYLVNLMEKIAKSKSDYMEIGE